MPKGTFKTYFFDSVSNFEVNIGLHKLSEKMEKWAASGKNINCLLTILTIRSVAPRENFWLVSSKMQLFVMGEFNPGR